MDTREFQWVEKYRPEKVEELILPSEMKAQFAKFVADGDMPNLLLVGPRGMGKTAATLAMIKTIGVDYIKINASLERNMDTIRERIAQFCSSVSFSGGRKFVILDEADGLLGDPQRALKGFIEEFSHNAGFILTANHLNKIIVELQSRCAVVEFRIPNSEKPKLAMEFMKRMEVILEAEGVKYDRKALAAFIQKWFPDWRRILNELQRYAAGGAIDTGILAVLSDATIDELIGYLKKKEFSNLRKWIGENSDSGAQTLFRSFYDRASSQLTGPALAEVVLIIAKYGFQSAFAVDQEINAAAAFTEVMMAASWKE